MGGTGWERIERARSARDDSSLSYRRLQGARARGGPGVRGNVRERPGERPGASGSGLERSGSAPGAVLRGFEKGPRHRRLLRSVFHRFQDRFGGHIVSTEGNKTLAWVVPKALSVVFTEDKFQEPLGRPTYTISEGFGGPSWCPKTYMWVLGQDIIQVCFAQTAALGVFCAEG